MALNIFNIIDDNPIAFCITPDRTISNKNNHDIVRSLHEYVSLLQRFNLKGLTLTYNIRDKFHFRYIIKQNNIKFYIITPKKYTTLVLQQFEHKFPKSTVLQVPITDIQIPYQNTSCCEIKYRRNNMFSLHVDRREETTPITKILSNIHNLKENDIASLDIIFQGENRLNWHDWVENQRDYFKKGKMPKRLYISPKDLRDSGLEFCRMIVDEFMSTIHLIGDGIFPKLTNKEDLKTKTMDIERRNVLIEGKLSKLTNNKQNYPTFKTYIRCLAHSENEDMRKIILSSLGNTFSELNEDNELEKREVTQKAQTRIIWEFNTLKFSWQSASSLDTNIMSSDELGKLIQLPTADVQDEYSNHLEIINKREISLPACITGSNDGLTDEDGIYLGDTTYKGQTIKTYLPIKDFNILCRPHLELGKMGTGKSTEDVRVALGFCTNGMTAIAIDVADGDVISEIRDGLPEDFPEDHIIDLDFGNLEYPIPLNWSEITTKLAKQNSNVINIESRKAANKLSTLLVDFINRMATSETTTRMEHYLTAISKAVLADPKNGLLEVILGLASDEYRNKILESGNIKDPLVYNTLRQLNDTKEPGVVKSILERLTVLLSNDYMRNCILQKNKLDTKGNALINFRKWIDGDTSPYFIGIRIPKEELGPLATDRLVSYLNAKIWLSALSRYDLPKKNGIHGRPFLLIQDEPHQFKSSYNILDDTVREARKWGMKLWWSAHKLEDFSFMEETLQASGVQYSLFSSSDKTYKKLLPELDPFTLEDLHQIPDQYYAIHKLAAPKGEDSIPPFLTYMPQNKKIKNREYRRLECNKFYGRHIVEVEEDIFKRSQIIYNKNKRTSTK